jgi:hypothetical protein
MLMISIMLGDGLSRHVRTKAEPIQPIPLFEELVELIMKVSVSILAGEGSELIEV